MEIRGDRGKVIAVNPERDERSRLRSTTGTNNAAGEQANCYPVFESVCYFESVRQKQYVH